MGPTSRFVICGKTIEIERHRGDLLAIRPPQPEDGRVGGVCHWALLPRVGALLRAPILRLPSAHGQHRPLTVSPLIHKLSALGRDMEMLVFGHAGAPVLVFPTSMGRFYEYEDFGMVGALSDHLEQGWLQLFCVDSVDGESWYNRGIPPHDCALRHNQYERYVIGDVVPFIRTRNR